MPMTKNKKPNISLKFQGNNIVKKILFSILLITIISSFAIAENESIFPENEKDTLSSMKTGNDTFKNCGGKVIVYKGLIYKTVYYENRCWLDRNLGANDVPNSLNDKSGFGRYFQWGRTMDGHEDFGSQVSYLISGIDNPGIGSFTTNNVPPYDWRVPQNDSLWQTTKNNPCPEGWRIPTLEEWGEVISNFGSLWDAFNSPLKIPASGFRDFSDGSYQQIGKNCLIWTSTSSNDNSYGIFFGSDEAVPKLQKRATGLPLRCIKQDIKISQKKNND
jgi:uncharacterized protein (TIGR02145 family)